MAEPTPMLIHLYARVGDSEVENEIGTVEVTADVVPPSPDAPEGAVASIRLDLAAALRRIADEIEAEFPPTPEDLTDAERLALADPEIIAAHVRARSHPEEYTPLSRMDAANLVLAPFPEDPDPAAATRDEWLDYDPTEETDGA